MGVPVSDFSSTDGCMRFLYDSEIPHKAGTGFTKTFEVGKENLSGNEENRGS
ncbi:hypothetical protein GW7_00886 [Heterocephalus glaber]|uniref:Uncharacterized protein n=1 Tax=Heterocephalus glaber TaxID=10181 RepID=G5BTR6_HETGA|nr:hypothetical protein GW7_00886 [Heterocephalus glaber]